MYSNLILQVQKNTVVSFLNSFKLYREYAKGNVMCMGSKVTIIIFLHFKQWESIIMTACM